MHYFSLVKKCQKRNFFGHGIELGGVPKPCLGGVVVFITLTPCVPLYESLSPRPTRKGKLSSWVACVRSRAHELPAGRLACSQDNQHGSVSSPSSIINHPINGNHSNGVASVARSPCTSR